MNTLPKYSQTLLVMGRGKGLVPSPTPTLATLKPPLALPQQLHTSNPLLNFNPNTRSSMFDALTIAASTNSSIVASNIITGKGTNKSPVQNELGYDDEYLKWAGLQPDRMPKHVMVILDGNRRWCEKMGRELTYEPFYRRYIMLGDICIKLGIPVASWSVFATCTWKRSNERNSLVFRQFQESLEHNLEKFTRQGIKVTIIGDKGRLPKWVQDTIEKVEEATKNGKALHMIYKMSYGGRWDIVEAARSISKKVIAGEIGPEDIDEAMVEGQLSTGVTANMLKPDLVVRCGGKRRLSNFYLWQSAYAEFYFSDLLYYDFGEAEFLDALRWYQHCGRRFGE